VNLTSGLELGPNMSFLRFANARLSQSSISQSGWDDVRSKATSPVPSFELRKASQVILQQYDPSQYLLSHVTIIASVDTENSGMPTGKQMFDGFQIDRRFPDFYITQGTQKYINSNQDSWERKLLLSCYRTFVGGENYCFLPGTSIIMADGTTKLLESVTRGDLVLTHTGAARRVSRTFRRDIDEEVVSLYFDRSKNPIKCTLNHPFRAISYKLPSWIPSGDLNVGDIVLGAESSVQEGGSEDLNGCRLHTLDWKEVEPYKGPVFNIEVEVDNSYVLSNGVAVHNCEHIQIPELSKGKIIDAAARDIGDSIYVDILVATDRKHKSIIDAISDGSLSTLSMRCFLPETPVTLGDGRRVPIRDVQPGEMVLTHRGRSREVLNQQIRVGTWDMRRIKVVGIPDAISATATHSFFVMRPAKTCACGCGQELELKDRDSVRRMSKRFKLGHRLRVLNPNGTYSIEEAQARKRQLDSIYSLKVEEVRADELKVGDYVVLPKLDSESFSDPGVAKARLLGYFLAKGSFLKHKGEPVEVQFNFSLNEKHTFVTETVQLLQEAFPGCNPWVQDRESRTTFAIHVTGKELVTWFRRHGGEYSHKKHLSLEVMHWSREAHQQLLGAWLNGDGGTHISGSVVGTTTSYDLACQLHILAIQCGLPARIECVFGGKSSTILEATINGESVRHSETGKLAYFNLVFPKTTSEPLVGSCAKASTKGGVHHLRVFDDMVVFPITDIEQFQYEGAVYDLEVEEDHSYQVEGVAVHNCHVSYTICTKCGNVAEDEAQLCTHIRYSKGQTFVDPKGKRRKVAEICGHFSDPNSVKFIEASWVAHPAFSGAVLRSILDPKTAELAEVARQKIQVAFTKPTEVFDPNSMQKAARLAPIGIGAQAKPADYLAYLYDGPSISTLHAPPAFSGTARAAENHKKRLEEYHTRLNGISSAQQDFPGQSEMGDSISSPNETEDSAKPFKQVINDLYESLVGEVTNKVKKDISESNKGEESTLDENRSNESLIKSALRYAKWRERSKMVLANIKDPSSARSILAGLILHDHGGWEAVGRANRFSGREILVMNRLLERTERKSSMAGDARIYRTVIAMGGTASYPDVDSYLTACREVIGRTLTNSEKVQLVIKGKLFSLGCR
jgi:hypothetical protein